MDLKPLIRKGVFDESLSYKKVFDFNGSIPDGILLLLEGKGRRKTLLTSKRKFYENYFPISFVGLEDILLGKSWKGAAGVFPGSHFVVWNSEDFMNSIQINPELARRAIYFMSKRIRIYNEKKKKIDIELQFDRLEDWENESSQVNDSIYQMTFSDKDEFPAEIIEQFSKPFKAGEYILHQEDKTREIYIILSGEASVIRTYQDGVKEKIDLLEPGSFIGEMSLFDQLPRSADVVAETDLLTVMFTPKNFHTIFKLHSKWSMKILKILAERIDQRKRELKTISINALYS